MDSIEQQTSNFHCEQTAQVNSVSVHGSLTRKQLIVSMVSFHFAVCDVSVVLSSCIRMHAHKKTVKIQFTRMKKLQI